MYSHGIFSTWFIFVFIQSLFIFIIKNIFVVVTSVNKILFTSLFSFTLQEQHD